MVIRKFRVSLSFSIPFLSLSLSLSLYLSLPFVCTCISIMKRVLLSIDCYENNLIIQFRAPDKVRISFSLQPSIKGYAFSNPRLFYLQTSQIRLSVSLVIIIAWIRIMSQRTWRPIRIQYVLLCCLCSNRHSYNSLCIINLCASILYIFIKTVWPVLRVSIRGGFY